LNRLLKRIFGLKRYKVTACWRRLCNEDLCDVYTAPNVWKTGKVHTGFWWETLRERDCLEYLGVDGRILLKRIFNKWNGGMHWLWIGTGSGVVAT